ncbi:MAG: DUF4340 domain-containing protein [Myxococcota bacterium]|jgi:hypothetical protein|nr:DUF4340 domain-containing protein [Myxococcota bacterium]
MTRKTIVSLGVFGMLLLITLVVALMPERREEIAWSIPKLADTMDRIEIVRQGQTVVLEKKGEKWAITQPQVYEASASALEGLLELFAKPIGMSLKLPVKAEELAQFEVDADKGITLKIGVTGKEVTAFVIGKALGKDTFIKPVAEDTVYRAKASLRWKLDKGLDDWREKKIFDVDQNKVSRLVVTQPDGLVVELAKDGDKWKVVRPQEAPADGGTVSSLLNALAGLQAAAFADQIPMDQAGFAATDRPWVIQVATTEAPELVGVEIGALVGKERLEGKYAEDSFVRRPGAGQLFVVRAYSVSNLRKGFSELRDRTIFSLSTDEVAELVVQGSGPRLHFVREAAGWNAKAPAELVGKVDENQVGSLVSTVATLRAAEIAAPATSPQEAGLAAEAPATAKLTLTMKDGTGHILLVGAKEPAPGNGEARYFAKLASGELIYRIGEYTVQRFLKDVTSFKKVAGPGQGQGLPPELMMPPIPGMPGQ